MSGPASMRERAEVVATLKRLAAEFEAGAREWESADRLRHHGEQERKGHAASCADTARKLRRAADIIAGRVR